MVGARLIYSRILGDLGSASKGVLFLLPITIAVEWDELKKLPILVMNM